MKYVLAILLFSGIVLFHELGHFLFAKLNHVRVNEFCLGLGPTLFGKTIGETKYSVKAFPVGGACMMEGEDTDSNDERSFATKTPWQRFQIVFGGPLFNFILAFLLSGVFLVAAGVDKPVITELEKGFPAEMAGMKAGDEIVKIDGHRIYMYQDYQAYQFFHPKDELSFTVKRDGKYYDFHLKKKHDTKSGRMLFGTTHNFSPAKLNPVNLMGYSLWNTKFWAESTIQGIKMLITGEAGFDQMSGPVGIVKAVGDTVDESKANGIMAVLGSLVNFAIMLSVNLGVVNLLPFPALDGGRIVLILIEGIRNKKIDQKVEFAINSFGLIFLFILMGFVIVNDVGKLI